MAVAVGLPVPRCDPVLVTTAPTAGPNPYLDVRFSGGRCSGGPNWYAYVNNDPVNWRDPWGLSPRDASSAGTGRALEPGTLITAGRPLGQLEFEQRYGFGNGVVPAASCQTVALINAYGYEGGVRVSDLDQAVAAWADAGLIPTTGPGAGSVGDWGPMSQILAREVGRDTYLEFRYPGGMDHPEMVSEAEFGTSGAGMGIAYLLNPEAFKPHWVLMTLTRTIDSLDPRRVGAEGYLLQGVQPLQTLPLAKR